LGELGDIIRARLRKKKMLKLKVRKRASQARSPHIFLALNMALKAGMRDKEIKTLTWAQIQGSGVNAGDHQFD
jgi:hypothetical protein